MAIMGSEIQFKGYEQHQGALLPSFVGDALDPSDPVFFVDDVVEGLDLGAFERRYAARGEHAFPPRMLLKLWLFGAIEGVYSGRAIARRLCWDLRFRYLAGDLRPDFRTINRFRATHREDFAQVFRESVRIAQSSGLVKLGRVAIDGTKMRANTSRHKAMGHGHMVEAEARLDDEIAQILAQIEELNEDEDDRHGDGDGGGGLPAELQRREQRREAIRRARGQLEAEKGQKLEARHQKSFADPEANMMKTGEGALTYCYNAQVAASEDGIIVATGVAASPSDQAQLEPMIEKVKQNTGRRPGTVLADKGYLSEGNLAMLRRRRQRAVIAVGRERKRSRKWPRGRLSRRMHRIVRLPWARDLYAHRKTQGERPFAEIKQTMRLRRFALRGIAKVTGEWDLVCAAANILTLHRVRAEAA
jgi:transposase